MDQYAASYGAGSTGKIATGMTRDNDCAHVVLLWVVVDEHFFLSTSSEESHHDEDEAMPHAMEVCMVTYGDRKWEKECIRMRLRECGIADDGWITKNSFYDIS